MNTLALPPKPCKTRAYDTDDAQCFDCAWRAERLRHAAGHSFSCRDSPALEAT
jgi:hypothetical protein